MFVWQKEVPGLGEKEKHALTKPKSDLQSSGLCLKKELKKGVNKI
jgi:hypothetical protein